MNRKMLPLIVASLLLIAGLILSLNGCGGGSSKLASPGRIEHVVIIFQENRTPDNLFQDPVLIARKADIAQSGLNSKGQTVQLSQTGLSINYNPNHNHKAFELMYDGGKMDGADLIPVSCEDGSTSCLPPNPQFTYVDPSDVQPYFAMAEQYTFADRMFQTNQGPSFPAHQFIISGTSAPSATSNLFVAENAVGFQQANSDTGCTAPAGEFVHLIDPTGDESSTMFPCLDQPTLIDEMDTKGITWRYYTPSANFLWTGPNAVKHICQPQMQGSQLVCTGPDWTGPQPDVVLNQTQVLTDIANNQLRQVSWVIPTGLASDHAASNDGSGPSWVASVVNAIGSSPYWANTAIFITWDDWGGWFDHVPPPQVLVNCSQWGCGYAYGFRVPLIVVSPYAKAGYVSHQTHDFGSILKFIEQTFNLPSLGFADAPADNLSDCFNFNQSPIHFQTIPAPMDATHFLNDKRPPTDPDDD